MGLSQILETASAGASSECTGSDGLIDPAGFACGASDLQPSRVEMAAKDLTKLGQAIRSQMTGIASDWSTLRPWYVAPEGERLLALMEAPADDSRDLEENLRTASDVLGTYADELVRIQPTLANLEWRATKFRERALDGVFIPVSESARPTLLQTLVGLGQGVEPEVRVYWRESAEAVAENDGLLAEYWQIIERLTTAADEVENGIRVCLTDTALVEDTQPIPAETFDAPYIEMPWGWPAKEEMNVVEDIAEGARRIGNGLLAILPVLGVDLATGQLSPGTAVNAWLGLGNMLGSAVLVAAYPEGKFERYGFTQIPWMQERYRTAESLGMMVGYDAAAEEYGESAGHEWRDNPWATAMDTAFNVLSFVAPSAGAARFAGVSARTSKWARITGLGADFLVPGGSYAVAGVTRVGGNLADMVRFGDRIPGSAVRPAALIADASDAFTHTPASDNYFGTTTAERPGGSSSVDEGVGSGDTSVAESTEPVPEPDLDGGAPPEQPPNGPPKTGGGDEGSGDAAGDDPAGGENVPAVRPELLSPWHPGVVSSVEPLHPDLGRAATYDSGDVHLPGWDPPRTPADTFTPGSGGEGWYAEVRQVSKPSFQYQIQASGIQPNAQGLLPEYYRTTPSGREISYDGMVMRGDVPFHQAMKNGWDDLAFDPGSPNSVSTLAKWIKQAKDQLAALPTNGVLEWHLSDPHTAAVVQQAFADPAHGLEEIVVLYTPRS